MPVSGAQEEDGSSDEEVIQKNVSGSDDEDNNDDAFDMLVDDVAGGDSRRFSSTKEIMDDHRLYDSAKYEKLYHWLYYSNMKCGYMCKICDIYYGSGRCRGAWSHKAVVLADNPGKKLRRHHNSDIHATAVKSLTNWKIEDAVEISEKQRELRENANELYISKLIKIVHSQK